ncbi:MAG: hypothetical protein IS860_02710 [Nitrosopumilus sp.]|nr:hypothetical protein [Nitrosopumilus sp.]MCE2507330.1 hypothetical protein [Nitrosopumilaceae archaeon]
MNSKGILGTKDFPFGVSIVAMFLPLIGIQIADSDNFSFGVILLGMLVGTFMTITNGSGRIIQLLYKIRLEKNTLKKLREDTVISAVIQKSFWDAVKTPSISYEEDKIISMVYFCIIIVLIIFNVVNDTHLFAEQFQNNQKVSAPTVDTNPIRFEFIRLIFQRSPCAPYENRDIFVNVAN